MINATCISKLNSSDVVQPVAIINQNCGGLNEIKEMAMYTHISKIYFTTVKFDYCIHRIQN